MADEDNTGKLVATLLQVAQEQVALQRAAALPAIRTAIEENLTRSEHRQAYELCDGERTGSEIASAVGTTPQSISNWTRRWLELGIAYETGGHIRRVTSLAAVGLPLDVSSESS